ncbi:MAG: hypothetical protein ACXAEU_21380, partial [Candidatus Hodarchaeales archaeon]
ALEKIQLFSPNASIHVFLHKTDLIPRQMVQKISHNVKEYLFSNIYREIEFYETTVFSEALIEIFGSIVSDIVGTEQIFRQQLEDFSRKNSNIISGVQILTEEGLPLIKISNNKQKVRFSSKQIKLYFDLSAKKLASASSSVESVFLHEDRNQLFITNFLNNGLAVVIGFFKKGLIDRNEASLTIYDRTVELSDHIMSLINYFT